MRWWYTAYVASRPFTETVDFCFDSVFRICCQHRWRWHVHACHFTHPVTRVYIVHSPADTWLEVSRRVSTSSRVIHKICAEKYVNRKWKDENLRHSFLTIFIKEIETIIFWKIALLHLHLSESLELFSLSWSEKILLDLYECTGNWSVLTSCLQFERYYLHANK